MDRHGEGSNSWFDDVLERAGIDAGRLAAAYSSRRPVVERNNPWKDPDGISEAGPVLDAALGKSAAAGRILYVTDVEDDPIARVQAAVQLGRAAVARGLDVLVVDADIRHVGLSRWLPDRDLDAEGLVDVLQYGASVAAARRPSEIDGIDVLGVGSYRPDAAGLFGGEDLRRLMAQLRVSAALVVVAGPARMDDRHFHPMAGHADAIVLSMHLDPEFAGPLGEFLAHLSELHRPLVGAFTWAGPDDSERFVDDALLERSRALPRATAGSPFPGRGAGAGESPGPGDGEERRPAAGRPASTGVPEPRAEEAAGPAGGRDDGPQSVRIRTERPKPGKRRGSGSSGVVRFFFVALAVVIVGFVGWWVVTWKSVEPTRPPAHQRAERAMPGRQPEPVVQATEDQEAAVGDEAAEPDPAGEQTAGAGALPAPDPDAGDDAGGSVETSRNADELLAQPVETAVEDVPPPVAEDPFEAGLKRSGSGWGLHLISSTDAREASTAQARYERQGYSAVVREATVKGQLWYRVVVGDFATKAEATRFREQAQEKFHVDWVGVVNK